MRHVGALHGERLGTARGHRRRTGPRPRIPVAAFSGVVRVAEPSWSTGDDVGPAAARGPAGGRFRSGRRTAADTLVG
ncbi:hypothetical protein JL475_30825 [Streptomyces sp. M2CJ-2]|uniref:hypothetical protein n=1 Tax=Streptomyces sp. M2CJ-2 TaxID=2803948 RepID=UPI0019296AE8|nr:hypothetical protein [Streptomyces sp. M2CJ-2]MBL3670293.1 hypothetical protein [Streptomyces sp. M2CJ-2]